ncbi:hypothetical protein Ddye_029795 [Dipteronia dyeriana]|uniref:RNase H type-1 domain-containing protein n=1 Tax=Dipteronia dyeriana TaxID=168575 RepID=A0AAD9TG69_9ROSI|nr:hypothetical protein Ddye_029795 [Dipteronia dyeriana]
MVASKPVPRWSPASMGLFKINSDVALRVSGIEVVIRDWKGRVRVSFCYNLAANLQPQVTEALAILKGIRLASSMGLVPAIVESEALTMVDAIRSQVAPCIDVGVIIHDIFKEVPVYGISKIGFVPLLVNMVAQGLARLALDFVGESLWLDDCPLAAESLVLGDCPISL